MAPPNWAYQVENFDPPADEELICSICRAVFCDPAQCPCNHVFCRHCISKWLESNKNCPVCRKRATRASIQDVVPLIKNMILKLILKCRNCKNGCEDKFNLEACESHMKTCMYETIKCKNESCSKEFLRKDIENHEHNECLYRCIKCTTCSLKISITAPHKHSCIRDLKKTLKDKKSIIKERNQVIKEQKEKIQQLTAEVKTLKSDNLLSDTSSLESLSTADIMISLADLSSLSSDSSLTQSISDDNDFDFHSWLNSTHIQERNDQNHAAQNVYEDNLFESRVFDVFDPDFKVSSDTEEQDSIECPRTSNSALENSLTVSTLSENDSSGLRRPAKRRHATRVLSQSDDNSDDGIPLRFIKSLKKNSGGKSNQPCTIEAVGSSTNFQAGSSRMEAGPSFLHSRTDSNDSSSSASKTKYSTRSRQMLDEKKSNGVVTDETRVNSSSRRAVFERTIELLERYNLESDPEWKPESVSTTSDSDENVEASPLELSSDSSSSDTGRRLFKTLKLPWLRSLQEEDSDDDEDDDN